MLGAVHLVDVDGEQGVDEPSLQKWAARAAVWMGSAVRR